MAVAAAVDFLIIASSHPDIAFVPTIVARAVVLNRVGVRYRVASVRSWIGMTLVAFGTFAVVASFAGCAAAIVMYG